MPAVGEEIEVTDGIIYTIFAGVITTVKERIEGRVLKYEVTCKDWTHYLDKKLVIERYENKTVKEIIDDINATYLTDFTANSVYCDLTISSIAFNRVSVSRCLQILAEQVNFNWYIGYDKDIHFFAKNTEGAPFYLSDDGGNYIFNSLEIIDDLTQIRNRVFIEGGEIKGTERAETYKGDGTKLVFPLSYKFSNEPTVTVGGVAQDVGIDNLHSEDAHDCFWSYQEKYIRFKVAPGAGVDISMSGTPLYAIIAQVQDDASIAMYGEYEFSVKDSKISSEEEARQYGVSQLEAYASKISEGSFQTYSTGLRAGQNITIQSDIRGLNSLFLIQRVTLTMRTATDGLWTAEVASLRTIGIISFLQKLLIDQNREIKIDDNVVLKKSYVLNETVNAQEEINRVEPYQDHETAQADEDIQKDPFGANVLPIMVLGPYFPSSHTDPKRPGRLSISMKLK
ncbi:MAG: hypothetical protein C4519_24405 [Desulfobacteraceae bacterium]|nr:MAG: hypothetical protein C4519_24405 [Desulfobacteraceae bacterium]